jgi:hypothetical protein
MFFERVVFLEKVKKDDHDDDDDYDNEPMPVPAAVIKLFVSFCQTSLEPLILRLRLIKIGVRYAGKDFKRNLSDTC